MAHSGGYIFNRAVYALINRVYICCHYCVIDFRQAPLQSDLTQESKRNEADYPRHGGITCETTGLVRLVDAIGEKRGRVERHAVCGGGQRRVAWYSVAVAAVSSILNAFFSFRFCNNTTSLLHFSPEPTQTVGCWYGSCFCIRGKGGAMKNHNTQNAGRPRPFTVLKHVLPAQTEYFRGESTRVFRHSRNPGGGVLL